MEDIQHRQPKHSWYVVYTFPNFEKKVYKLLLQKNIQSFLLLHKVIRQWSDRKKMVDIPLFPNYIFVNLSIHEKYKVLDIRGVVCFVSLEGRPVVVPDHEINALKKIIEREEIVTEKGFQEGDMVHIVEGPFVGIKGVIFKRRGMSRIGLKIESINKIISIEMCSSFVKKTEAKIITSYN